MSLVPNTLTFLNQVAAHPLVAGASQMIYLTNTSNLAITVGNLTGTDTIIGTSATGDFVVANSTLFGVNVPGSDSCSGVTIPPNSNCFVTVFFAPSTLGAKTGSIIFPITYSDGTKGSYIAPLSGNGIAVVNTLNVTPASVQYQPQVVGTARWHLPDHYGDEHGKYSRDIWSVDGEQRKLHNHLRRLQQHQHARAFNLPLLRRVHAPVICNPRHANRHTYHCRLGDRQSSFGVAIGACHCR